MANIQMDVSVLKDGYGYDLPDIRSRRLTKAEANVFSALSNTVPSNGQRLHGFREGDVIRHKDKPDERLAVVGSAEKGLLLHSASGESQTVDHPEAADYFERVHKDAMATPDLAATTVQQSPYRRRIRAVAKARVFVIIKHLMGYHNQMKHRPFTAGRPPYSWVRESERGNKKVAAIPPRPGGGAASRGERIGEGLLRTHPGHDLGGGLRVGSSVTYHDPASGERKTGKVVSGYANSENVAVRVGDHTSIIERRNLTPGAGTQKRPFAQGDYVIATNRGVSAPGRVLEHVTLGGTPVVRVAMGDGRDANNVRNYTQEQLVHADQHVSGNTPESQAGASAGGRTGEKAGAGRAIETYNGREVNVGDTLQMPNAPGRWRVTGIDPANGIVHAESRQIGGDGVTTQSLNRSIVSRMVHSDDRFDSARPTPAPAPRQYRAGSLHDLATRPVVNAEGREVQRGDVVRSGEHLYRIDQVERTSSPGSPIRRSIGDGRGGALVTGITGPRTGQQTAFSRSTLGTSHHFSSETREDTPPHPVTRNGREVNVGDNIQLGDNAPGHWRVTGIMRDGTVHAIGPNGAETSIRPQLLRDMQHSADQPSESAQRGSNKPRTVTSEGREVGIGDILTRPNSVRRITITAVRPNGEVSARYADGQGDIINLSPRQVAEATTYAPANRVRPGDVQVPAGNQFRTAPGARFQDGDTGQFEIGQHVIGVGGMSWRVVSRDPSKITVENASGNRVDIPAHQYHLISQGEGPAPTRRPAEPEPVRTGLRTNDSHEIQVGDTLYGTQSGQRHVVTGFDGTQITTRRDDGSTYTYGQSGARQYLSQRQISRTAPAPTPSGVAPSSNRRAGNTGEQAKFTGKNVQVNHGSTEADTKAAIKNIFGAGSRVTPMDLARVAGAPDGATVTINARSTSNYVTVNVTHPYIATQSRTISRNGQGQLEMHNDIFQSSSAAPKGYGVRAFSSQVENARRIGMDEITVHGVGSWDSAQSRGGWNGYYTWARFGYNTRLTAAQKASYGQVFGTSEAETPKTLNAVMSRQVSRENAPASIKPLMELEGGKFDLNASTTWWKRYGSSINATFDLKDNSSSIKVLNAYRAEYGLPAVKSLDSLISSFDAILSSRGGN